MTVYDVIAEPRRRKILELLSDRERPVGELVSELGISQPGASKHLRILREAGLVEVRGDAQRRLYRLRPEPLGEVEAWAAARRRIWNERLDRLERHLSESSGR
jgi:DNA-binding transcriptional ArsR family regulator